MRRILFVLLAYAVAGGCTGDESPPPEVSAPDPILTAEDVWVATAPIQCLGNPWERDWLDAHGGDYAGYPKDPHTPGLEPEEIEIIRDFYKRQGVVVSDVTSTRWDHAVCLACSCPEGYTLYLLVRPEDVETMIAFGYRKEEPPPRRDG